jgi:hypothetical protein
MEGCSGPVEITADGSHVYAENNRMTAYGYMLDGTTFGTIEPKGFVLLPNKQEIPMPDSASHNLEVSSFKGFDMNRWGTSGETLADKAAIANIGVVVTAIVDLVGVLPVDFSGTSVGFCMNIADLKTVGGIIYDASSFDAVGVIGGVAEFVYKNVDNLAYCLWASSIDTVKKDALITGLKGIAKSAGEVTQIYNAYVIFGKVAPVLWDLWNAKDESGVSYCVSRSSVDKGACAITSPGASAPTPFSPPSPTPTPAPTPGCDVSSAHFCVMCSGVPGACTAEWKSNYWSAFLTKLESIRASYDSSDGIMWEDFTFNIESTDIPAHCGYSPEAMGNVSSGIVHIMVDRDAVFDADLAEELRFIGCHEIGHQILPMHGGNGSTNVTTIEQIVDWFAYEVCGYESSYIKRFEDLGDKSGLCGIMDPLADSSKTGGGDCAGAACSSCCFYSEGECRGAMTIFWSDNVPSMDAYISVDRNCEGVPGCNIYEEIAGYNGDASYNVMLADWKSAELGCRSTCTSGPCCDTGTGRLRPSSHVCSTETEYSCAWGTGCGSDVGVRSRDRFCSGTTSLCDGAYSDWSGYTVLTDCASNQNCQASTSTCVLNPSCTCVHACTMGAVRCESGRLYSCITNPSGCRVWDSGTACPSGICSDSTHCSGCTAHHHQGCYSDDLYWFDSCGTRETVATDCGTDEWTGTTTCSSGDVYQSYIDRGCTGAACTSSTSSRKKEECGDRGCSGGVCCTHHASYRCYDSDVYWYSGCNSRQDKKEECGGSTPAGSNYCYDNDVYRDYLVGSCSSDRCVTETQRQKISECGSGGCSGGSCCTSHASYRCDSGDVYYFNSCGVREGIKQDCHSTQTCSVDRCVCPSSTPWTSNLLTATPVSGGVRLTWNAAPSSWIHHYVVTAVPGASTPPPGMSISGNLTSTSFTHTTGTHGQRYTYLVYGYDACNANRNTSSLAQATFP